MIKLKPKLGRGKNMSIARAALIYYFESMLPESENAFIYSGDLDVHHKIVDLAGAKHCSVLTAHRVLGCLNASPYWKSGLCQTKGWLNRRANTYRPSELGKQYYENNLRK